MNILQGVVTTMMDNLTKSIMSALGGLKVVIPAMLFIVALLTYLMLTSSTPQPAIEVLDFSSESNTTQSNINTAAVAPFSQAISDEHNTLLSSTTKQPTILPLPAKKLTKLIEQPIAVSQTGAALAVDQAMTQVNLTIENIDQQLSALGYSPDIINHSVNIDDLTSQSDPVLIERFEKLKAIIQQ
jgi:hypothetical protein